MLCAVKHTSAESCLKNVIISLQIERNSCLCSSWENDAFSSQFPKIWTHTERVATLVAGCMLRLVKMFQPGVKVWKITFRVKGRLKSTTALFMCGPTRIWNILLQAHTCAKSHTVHTAVFMLSRVSEFHWKMMFFSRQKWKDVLGFTKRVQMWC